MFNPLGFASLSTLEANEAIPPGCWCSCNYPVTIMVMTN